MINIYKSFKWIYCYRQSQVFVINLRKAIWFPDYVALHMRLVESVISWMSSEDTLLRA